MFEPNDGPRCSFSLMFAVLRTHRLLHTVLSLSLLLSAAGPLVRTACTMGDTDRLGHSDNHLEAAHPHTSTDEYAIPCPRDRDTMRTENMPCSKHAVSCCALQAVPAREMAAVLFEDSRFASGELILARLPDFKSNGGIEAHTPWRISPVQCPTCLQAANRQALLGTFLI